MTSGSSGVVTVRRHQSWLVPLVLAIGAFVTMVWVSATVPTSANHKLDGQTGGRSVVVLIALMATMASSVYAVRNGSRAYRAHRRAHGRYTRRELAALERAAQVEAAATADWQAARGLLNQLAANGPPPALTVWGLVLDHDEQAHLEVTAAYSRYYGGDGSYVHVNGFFFGSAPFVVAGYALTALGNSSRRAAARNEAALRWREHQTAHVLLTNRRLVCNVAGRWLSFYYSAVTAVYPEPLNWSVVLDFADTQPLRLTGPGGLTSAIYAVWALHGSRGLREHPQLEALRRP